MKKQTAVIIVFLFCALAVGLVAYVYKQNVHLSPQAYDEALVAFNENNPNAIIDSLKGKAKNTDERILLASAYLQLGSTELREQEGFALAKPLLEEVLKENPDDSEALRLIAYGYEITEDFVNADMWYDKAIRADIGNAQSYSGKAHTLALQGEIDEAIRQYDLALQVDPNLDHAQMGIARLYIKKEINDDKVTQYLDAVITGSANKRFVAEAAQLKGGFLMNRSKFTEAKTAFDLAITTDPTLGQAYVGRAQAGFVLFKESSKSAEDDFAALMKDIQKATEVNPELTVAYYTGGTLLEYNGHKEIADALYIQALEVVDKDISLSSDEKAAMKDIIDERLK